MCWFVLESDIHFFNITTKIEIKKFHAYPYRCTRYKCFVYTSYPLPDGRMLYIVSNPMNKASYNERISYAHVMFNNMDSIQRVSFIRTVVAWSVKRWIKHISQWYILTHWGRDKMAAVAQTTLSNALSWMKMLEFLLRFHWSLFLRIQLTIFQHWFR